VRWLAESWWGCNAIGVGNVLRRNCLWPTNPDGRYNANGGLDGGAGYRTQANRVANPLYADREAKDFRLKRTSACVGRGPRAVPGP
jgi:hypothetical protein